MYRHYATKLGMRQQPYDNSFYIVHVSVINGVLPIERIMTAAGERQRRYERNEAKEPGTEVFVTERKKPRCREHCSRHRGFY